MEVRWRRVTSDDLRAYTARAAIEQLALVDCWGLAHRKLTGAGDLYATQFSSRLQLAAG